MYLHPLHPCIPALQLALHHHRLGLLQQLLHRHHAPFPGAHPQDLPKSRFNVDYQHKTILKAMPDMLTVLTPSMTKLSKYVEDVFEVRLLVIVYHVVHLVNLKPVTGRLLMLIMTDGSYNIHKIIQRPFFSVHCSCQVPCNVERATVTLHNGHQAAIVT